MYIHIYIYTYLHIYICTCIDLYIYTYIHRSLFSFVPFRLAIQLSLVFLGFLAAVLYIYISIIYPCINPYKIQRCKPYQAMSLVSPPALGLREALPEDLLLGGFFIHHAYRSDSGGRVQQNSSGTTPVD